MSDIYYYLKEGDIRERGDELGYNSANWEAVLPECVGKPMPAPASCFSTRRKIGEHEDEPYKTKGVGMFIELSCPACDKKLSAHVTLEYKRV